MTNIEQSNEKRQRSQAITQTEWEQYMAEKILRLIRHELYMDFRYMDGALIRWERKAIICFILRIICCACILKIRCI